MLRDLVNDEKEQPEGANNNRGLNGALLDGPNRDLRFFARSRQHKVE